MPDLIGSDYDIMFIAVFVCFDRFIIGADAGILGVGIGEDVLFGRFPDVSSYISQPGGRVIARLPIEIRRLVSNGSSKRTGSEGRISRPPVCTGAAVPHPVREVPAKNVRNKAMIGGICFFIFFRQFLSFSWLSVYRRDVAFWHHFRIIFASFSDK